MVVSADMVGIGMGIYYSFDGPIVLRRYFKYFLSCFLVVSAVYKINIRIVPAVDTYLRRTFNIIALRADLNEFVHFSVYVDDLCGIVLPVYKYNLFRPICNSCILSVQSVFESVFEDFISSRGHGLP